MKTLLIRNKKGQFEKGGFWTGKKRPNLSLKYRGSNNPNWKNKPIKTCIDCQKIIKGNNAIRCKSCAFKGRTVSKEARLKMSQAKIGKYNGKNNPSWKGGITPLHLLIRTSNKYLEWRDKVFKRDYYTCQRCAKTDCFVEAHHIKEFSTILRDFLKSFPNEDTIIYLQLAINYAPFWNIDNGQTLCRECHNKTKLGR